VCENGKLVLYRSKMKESEFSRIAPGPFADPGSTREEIVGDGENPQHVGVFNAFAGKLLRGTPLVADGSEGIFGLTISNAMHLSSWLGRPVELPFDEKLFKAELDKRVATSRRLTEVVEQVSTVGSK
jgi:hypothetical protein